MSAAELAPRIQVLNEELARLKAAIGDAQQSAAKRATPASRAAAGDAQDSAPKRAKPAEQAVIAAGLIGALAAAPAELAERDVSLN